MNWSWKAYEKQYGKPAAMGAAIVKKRGRKAAGEVGADVKPEGCLTSPNLSRDSDVAQDGVIETVKPSVALTPSTPIKRAKRKVAAKSGGVGDGQTMRATQLVNSHANTNHSPQQCGDGEEVQTQVGTQHEYSPLSELSISKICIALREHQRYRCFAIKTQNKLNNAIGALVRSFLGWKPDLTEKESNALRARAASLIKDVEKGNYPPEFDSCPEIIATILSNKQAVKPFDVTRENHEKQMRTIVRHLPIYSWASGIRGFGDLGLAIIVAEAGADLSSYDNPAKLWKRLGLAVINGERQRRVSGDDAVLHGYSPQRRAQIWSIIDSMAKHQLSGKNEDGSLKREPGPYGQAYYNKRTEYDERVARTGNLEAKNPEKWTPKRAHSAALRFMTKKLVKDIWIVWKYGSLDAGVAWEPERMAAE